MKMRKYMTIVLTLCLLFTFAACGAGDWQNPSAGEENSQASSVEVSEDDYEDTLDGLCAYLTANGIISGEATEMKAEMIGAQAGKMYAHTYDGGQASVELYSYDPANLDEIATGILDSVKTNGKFSLLGTESEAVLSDSGKYLMIYKSVKDKEEDIAQKERALKYFCGFKK